MHEHFSIFQADFYEFAKNGSVTEAYGTLSADEWFQAAVLLEFRAIASLFGCSCQISELDTNIARQFWFRDVGRMEIDGDGVPNHFKQAGFLSYWLRRRMALRNPTAAIAYDSEKGRERQDIFITMAPELASFVFGFNLCLFAESKAKYGDELIPHLRAKFQDLSFLYDICVVMRNKHISPHSMMMIYRALFMQPLI